MPAASSNQRSIVNIIDTIATIEGDGLEIRRAFPHAGLDAIDPFLLLDHMGPMADPTAACPITPIAVSRP